MFLGRCINVVELTLFQRGIRVDFSSASFNDVATTSCNRRQNDLHFQHFYNVVSTLLDVSSDVVSTFYRRLFAHWDVIEVAIQEEHAVTCPVVEFSSQEVSHFPCERPKVLNDEQRRFVIQRGPCQPRLKLFPINETIAKNKQNKFNPSWYDSFPHLEYSRKQDKAFCFVCSLFPSGPGRERSDEAWVNGVRS